MTVSVEHGLRSALDAGELGVQVACYVGNELIVDECVGLADRFTGTPVTPETLFCVFSVSKAITVTALHLQVERGRLAYDAPVSRYWPEFGRHGKAATTVRDVLTHRAGIPQMPAGVTVERMCDWDWMVAQVAELEPMFPPGTTSAYHALVYGWIIGELVVRSDPEHRPFGRFVREEICDPLAIEDLWFGVPDEDVARVATLSTDMAPPASDGMSSLTMPPAVAPCASVHNRRDVVQACIPGAGAIMSARAGARFFALLANAGQLDGVRLLQEETVHAMTKLRTNPTEIDQALAGGGTVAPPIGVGGYWLADPVAGPGPGMLCHGGSGGSIGWADLDRRLGATICHNRMFDTIGAAAVLPHPFAGLGDALRALPDEGRLPQA